jgi:hypothetical protein
MRPLWPFLISAILFAQEGIPPAQQPPITSASNEDDLEWVCPMDKDIRSKTPGDCPRCHMKMVRGIPEAVEYPVRITTTPHRLAPDQETELTFRVNDPKTGKIVRDFEMVHDRIFHLFIVSQDTTFFAHEHPEQLPDGSFRFRVRLPKAAEYRLLCDFYPKSGTPQLIANTLIVPGKDFKLSPPQLQPQMEPQQAANLSAELVTEPAEPVAGAQTLMFFRLKPNDGLEQYLSAWGHMMAASSDLIDMIHTHPIYVTDPEGGAYKQIQFNLIFPRPGVYRLWVQFQRKGVVNTVVFNVPVSELK